MVLTLPFILDRDCQVIRRCHSVAALLLSLSNGSRLLVLEPHISSSRPLLLILRRSLRLLLFDVSHESDDVETSRCRRLNRK